MSKAYGELARSRELARWPLLAPILLSAAEQAAIVESNLRAADAEDRRWALREWQSVRAWRARATENQRDAFRYFWTQLRPHSSQNACQLARLIDKSKIP